jgi:hypothetical protein
MHATTPIDAVPTTRRHLNTEPLRTIHARALVLAHTSGEPIEAARRALALGLLILRAQRREAKRERFLAGHDALSTDGSLR